MNDIQTLMAIAVGIIAAFGVLVGANVVGLLVWMSVVRRAEKRNGRDARECEHFVEVKSIVDPTRVQLKHLAQMDFRC